MNKTHRNFWRQVTACIPLAHAESRGAGLRRQLGRLPLGGLSWGMPGLAGRAAQLNAMALQARSPYLWQLHADSVLGPGAPEALAGSAGRWPLDLHYFRLKFATDGPALTRLNAVAANWRSRSLGLPFGDQGFLVPRLAFLRAGAYDEGLKRGEDLDFVVRAARWGMKLREVPADMETSARRYGQQGWLATTAAHAALTAALALRARLKPRVPDLKPALAAFVKTPGHSPIKTRLAADLNPRKAARLYEASLGLAGSLLAWAGGSGLYSPLWNVAESQALADRRWRGLDRRWAGPGSLAERLHQSYASLLEAHGSAAFIGADSPQLSPRQLNFAYQALLGHDFVLIPAFDGGYVLFAGRKEIPRAVWLDVPLSQGDTCERFAVALRRLGSLKLLEPMADLDRSADLPAVMAGVAEARRGNGGARGTGPAARFLRAARS